MEIGKVIVTIGSEHELTFDSFGKCVQGDESLLADGGDLAFTVITSIGGIIQDQERLAELLNDFPNKDVVGAFSGIDEEFDEDEEAELEAAIATEEAAEAAAQEDE